MIHSGAWLKVQSVINLNSSLCTARFRAFLGERMYVLISITCLPTNLCLLEHKTRDPHQCL